MILFNSLSDCMGKYCKEYIRNYTFHVTVLSFILHNTFLTTIELHVFLEAICDYLVRKCKYIHDHELHLLLLSHFYSCMLLNYLKNILCIINDDMH